MNSYNQPPSSNVTPSQGAIRHWRTQGDLFNDRIPTTFEETVTLPEVPVGAGGPPGTAAGDEAQNFLSRVVGPQEIGAEAPAAPLSPITQPSYGPAAPNLSTTSEDERPAERHGPNPFIGQVDDEGIATDPEGIVPKAVVRGVHDPANEPGFLDRQRAKLGLTEGPFEDPNPTNPKLIKRDEELDIETAPPIIGSEAGRVESQPAQRKRTPEEPEEEDFGDDPFRKRKAEEGPHNPFGDVPGADRPKGDGEGIPRSVARRQRPGPRWTNSGKRSWEKEAHEE